MTKPNRVQRALALLRAARSGATGKRRRRIGSAVTALHPPKSEPKPKPAQAPAPMPPPYALTTHDGKKVDQLTHYALLAVEKILGYSLSILQGSYNAGGVSASAGTHDGGGVVDLSAWDWERKVHAMRLIGFAAWHRTAIPGLWGEHIHCVLIGNAKLAPAAAQQIVDYCAHRDGLAQHRADNTWHPDPIPTFTMPKAG